MGRGKRGRGGRKGRGRVRGRSGVWKGKVGRTVRKKGGGEVLGAGIDDGSEDEDDYEEEEEEEGTTGFENVVKKVRTRTRQTTHLMPQGGKSSFYDYAERK
ncbi:hypothetical protein BDW02DRAFT_577852 [Decorospora gaudefroyi]|uniref:Uncharacterized protein n=1 Tax=Decorospora gaudefroyi TaxID=184978 RepID=A0A6A5KQ19_9PLEO|nr:hypothetical protein BDW02DRAFT_577852 [Decorospora gaudefroyi]